MNNCYIMETVSEVEIIKNGIVYMIGLIARGKTMDNIRT